MTNIIMYPKKVDDWGALCGWPRLSDYNECGVFARGCVCHAQVCVPYHCKPFCWCFLLLILSLGSCYIKLLSGLPVWKKKKSCLKCFCAHVHCPQYKDSECVCGMGMRGNRAKERGTYRNANIYRGRKRLRGGRGRQRGGRSIVWCLAENVE